MRYIGAIYRPPSEAYSLLLQVTIGCAHNKCTFCNMYKAKNFRVRPLEEILDDLNSAKSEYGFVERIFLCDGDALCLSNDRLIPIFERINKLFPNIDRITSYGRASDINRKTDDELITLQKLGLTMVYIGAESGSNIVLEKICKGETKEEIVKAVNRLENLGIKTSVTFISGLAGPDMLQEHAIETGKMITEMNASYVSLLTLMLEEPAPLVEEFRKGKFKLLSPLEVLEETKLILENSNPSKTCIFRSNHASNYISLRGNLPHDKERLIDEIDYYVNNDNLLKDELLK